MGSFESTLHANDMGSRPSCNDSRAQMTQMRREKETEANWVQTCNQRDEKSTSSCSTRPVVTPVTEASPTWCFSWNKYFGVLQVIKMAKNDTVRSLTQNKYSISLIRSDVLLQSYQEDDWNTLWNWGLLIQSTQQQVVQRLQCAAGTRVLPGNVCALSTVHSLTISQEHQCESLRAALFLTSERNDGHWVTDFSAANV